MGVRNKATPSRDGTINFANSGTEYLLSCLLLFTEDDRLDIGRHNVLLFGNQIHAHTGLAMSNIAEVNATKKWLNSVVVDLNLCPFAKRELNNDKVRFVLSQVTTEKQLLDILLEELTLLHTDPNIETTLLIHPSVLNNFFDFNDFLFAANGLIAEQGFEGIFQLASFHPNYQFAGVDENEASNYTNRSPYPMLHILREASLTKAIDAYPDVDKIPERNIELMQDMGGDRLRLLLEACTRNF